MDAARVVQQHIELRLLRYMIAVAEELHFGRAAKRLNISAPSLSKQIKDLEQSLGYALFRRKTRDVALTPAGAAFLLEARQALVHVERAVECGHAAHKGNAGVFSLGYSPWFRPSLLAEVQKAFAERVARVKLSLHSAYTPVQIDLILKGVLDAGIVVLPVAAEGLQARCIWHDELVAVLPSNHSLASQAKIDRQDLADEPVVWAAKVLNPTLHQSFLESCRRWGYVPNIVHEISTVPEMLDLIAQGEGIGFVKKSTAARTNESGIVFRELCSPGLFIETGLAFRTGNSSEALRVLIELLRDQSTCPE